MAAFNWIEFDSKCPVCGMLARIRAQTHVAADFGADASGRFCDRTYGIGDRIAWWPSGDRRFNDWSEAADPGRLPAVQEACYATCRKGEADLCAVVEFEELRVERVVSLTTADNWPDGYVR